MGHARTDDYLLFVELAQEHLVLTEEWERKALDVDGEMDREMTRSGSEYPPIDLLEEASHAQRETAKHALIVIVFAALTCESYIYDYAARHFSDTFVRKYLDKLDVMSKWVVVPRLVTGKDLPTGGQALQLLRELVTARNEIVHYKTTRLTLPDPDFDKRLAELSLTHPDIAEKARRAVRALEELSREMQRVDPTETEFLRLLSDAPAGPPT